MHLLFGMNEKLECEAKLLVFWEFVWFWVLCMFFFFFFTWIAWFVNFLYVGFGGASERSMGCPSRSARCKMHWHGLECGCLFVRSMCSWLWSKDYGFCWWTINRRSRSCKLLSFWSFICFLNPNAAWVVNLVSVGTQHKRRWESNNSKITLHMGLNFKPKYKEESDNKITNQERSDCDWLNLEGEPHL